MTDKKSLFQSFSDGFWNEKVWLPTNKTWNDFSPPSDNRFTFTQTYELFIPIKIALFIIVIRMFLEKYFFDPMGIRFEVQKTRFKKPDKNATLEKVYNGNLKINTKLLIGLTKQLDWTEQEIERWFRLRKAQEKSEIKLKKFSESCWRLAFYMFIFVFGIYSQYDAPWWRDPVYFIADIPHPITTPCWWYCMITCGFYWASTLGQCFDVRRKDFYQMLTHHIILIFLISLTWITNTHRFTCAGLLIHDCSDVLLEAAKIAKYCAFQKTATFVFLILTTVWIGTRCVFYPYWILRISIIHFLHMYSSCLFYIISNILLLVVFVFNIIWLTMMMKVIRLGWVNGMEKTHDDRSEDEDSFEEERSLRLHDGL